VALFKRANRSAPAAEPAKGEQNAPAGSRATETFQQALSREWAHLLRELGFKGSGRVYVLPDENDWVMLGFQSSNASSAEGVKFTINPLVVGKAEWVEARERAS
jgi:hypothetical protein